MIYYEWISFKPSKWLPRSSFSTFHTPALMYAFLTLVVSSRATSRLSHISAILHWDTLARELIKTQCKCYYGLSFDTIFCLFFFSSSVQSLECFSFLSPSISYIGINGPFSTVSQTVNSSHIIFFMCEILHKSLIDLEVDSLGLYRINLLTLVVLDETITGIIGEWLDRTTNVVLLDSQGDTSARKIIGEWLERLLLYLFITVI